MDFEDLLPENMGAANEPLQLVTNDESNRHLSLNFCSRSKRSISDFSAWLEAWNNLHGHDRGC